jgi:hypothetical protein
MSPAEVGWRVRDRVLQAVWVRGRSLARSPTGPAPGATAWSRRTGAGPPRLAPRPAAADLAGLPDAVRRAILSEAKELLTGRARMLGVERSDMADPEWALDPVSGRSFPSDRPAFLIDYRSPADTRHVKQVWELSRHHHLTLLACAWRLSGDDRYAAMAARHLRSWWAGNPVLMGINWASGIEISIRLISWAWCRRLLEGWTGAPALFEGDQEAVAQVYWHQRYLAAFPSRGSSANNHAVAEAAGLLVGSCAFSWFDESPRWRAEARARLERELARSTFDDGVNREQASGYHAFVAELGLVAGAEAEAAGAPLDGGTWRLLCRMLDVVAAVPDRTGRPPRYGDGDDGRVLAVDGGSDRWASLLASGSAIFGPLDWWPPTRPDARSLLLAALVGRTVDGGPRPGDRPSHFPDAGLTILRTPPDPPGEIWCRCDGGPHGHLSIAAHAHADALSVEVRHDGVDVLADPGTFCYQGDPLWRRYFRSTLAHNTLELDAQDQSVPGGPFLWSFHATTTLVALDLGGDGPMRWTAEHDGYRRLRAPAVHRRTVSLDPSTRSVGIEDRVSSDSDHDVALAFHLGPSVEAHLEGHRAALSWVGSRGEHVRAHLVLPERLEWTCYRGSVDPPLGWYSPEHGRKMPTTTLVGRGRLANGVLSSELRFVVEPQGTRRPGSAPGSARSAGSVTTGGSSTDAAIARSRR